MRNQPSTTASAVASGSSDSRRRRCARGSRSRPARRSRTSSIRSSTSPGRSPPRRPRSGGRRCRAGCRTGLVDGRGRRGLGQPVPLVDRGAEGPLEPLQHGHRQRRAAGDAHRAAGAAACGAASEAADVHGGHAEEQGRPLLEHQLDGAARPRSAASRTSGRRPGRCEFMDTVWPKVWKSGRQPAPCRRGGVVDVEGVDRRVQHQVEVASARRPWAARWCRWCRRRRPRRRPGGWRGRAPARCRRRSPRCPGGHPDLGRGAGGHLGVRRVVQDRLGARVPHEVDGLAGGEQGRHGHDDASQRDDAVVGPHEVRDVGADQRDPRARASPRRRARRRRPVRRATGRRTSRRRRRRPCARSPPRTQGSGGRTRPGRWPGRGRSRRATLAREPVPPRLGG